MTEDFDEYFAPKVWHTYDVVDDGQGGANVHCGTNDNFDMGYPSQTEYWDLHFNRVEDALKHAGFSRTGVYGGKVTVTYNGEERTQA